MKKFYLALSMMLTVTVGAFAQGETCATVLSVAPGVHNADGPQTGSGASNVCLTFANNSDWYSFTPICDGTINVTSDYPIPNAGSGGQRLSIHSGICSALVCEGSNNGFGGGATVSNLAVTGGDTYFIEWDDNWGNGSFEWTLNFELSGAVQNPTGIPGINDATLTWVESGNGETSWDVEWGTAGFGLGSGTPVTTTGAGNTFTSLTSLTPETTYDFYIAVGGSGCFAGPFSFTTLPLCSVPDIVSVTPNGSGAALDWDPGNVETQWDLQYGPFGSIIGAGTAENGLTTSAYVATGLNACTDYHWYVRAVCDNYTPTEYSNWVGPLDFTTECVCPEPSALIATEDPANAFNYILDWTLGGTETEWTVYYTLAGEIIGGPNWTSVSVNTAPPYTLAGLVPDTDYDFYVTSNCGTTSDSISPIVGPVMFTTGTFCPEPTGLGVSNLTTNAATLNWTIDGSSTEWTIEWGEAGFTQGGAGSTVSTLLSNNATLTGLTPDTDYCFYVQSNCGSTADSVSTSAGPFCFTTIAACPAPTSLNVFNISNTAANLDWQAGPGLTDFTVQWGFPGFTPDVDQQGSGTTTGGITQLYVTTLNAGAPYQFYVQTNCAGADGNSVWTGPFSFTTLLVNDLACGAVNLVVDGVVNVHTNEGATVNGEAVILPPLSFAHTQLNWYNTSNTMQAPVWFKFTAPASGKVEVSTTNDVTLNANTNTEIAVYETGDCALFSNYTLLAANSFSAGTAFGDPGSIVLLCDLTPEQEYYVVVDVNNTSFTPGPNGVFGISVTDIPETNAGTATPLNICGDGTPVDLFDGISGNSTNTGTWYNPSIVNPTNIIPGANSEVTLPIGAGIYSFDYLISNACGVDTVTLTILAVQPPNAGMDGSFTTCNVEDILLVSHLNGLVELGGVWADVDGVHNVANGIFNAYGVPYGTYNFSYTVAGNGTCPADVANLTVTLNDDCLGIEDNATEASLEVYPNPASDVLTIANLNLVENALVTVYDTQGKTVFTNTVSSGTSNYTIDMTSLEAGVYVVELTSENTLEKVRVIKQ